MDFVLKAILSLVKIKGDKQLRYILGALMCISVVFVFTSTTVFAYQKQGGNLTFYPLRHMIFLGLSWLAAAFISKLSTKLFNRFALFICLIGIGLAWITPFCGVELNGATRWLEIGGIAFQPSEIAKIALIFFVAKVLSIHKKEPSKAFWPIVIATAFTVVPIIIANLSTALLIMSTVLGLMIIGSIPAKKITALGLVLLCAGIAYLYLLPQEYQMGRTSTWKGRVERFIGLEDDPVEDTGKNFQAEQARLAVAHSGLLGTGFGMSYVKNFLPMAYSDFIFSTILEECGAWGGVIVILVFLWLLVRAIQVAQRCDSAFEIYLILGLAIIICLQAFINMAVGVGLIPVTGQTLPLISMGGTSNVIVGGVMGVMLSISAHNMPKEKVKETPKAKQETIHSEFVSDDITNDDDEEENIEFSESRDN
ncbi:MAG: FtsW/RodA/SpoVE family cell cycle protein [Bacteroidia bacterium]|nr:FtsW/RodA/SpoVE family cell cycle protein [Bacteroidia bacterium]